MCIIYYYIIYRMYIYNFIIIQYISKSFKDFKPNLYFLDNKDQQVNQQTKKFKSLFDQDDGDKKETIKKEEIKNPAFNKRLNFLFEDD